MLAEITVKKQVEIKFVKVDVAVRYDEDDIPNDFPLRKGDMWSGTIDIDEGRILGWPAGKTGNMRMKVCDQGSYHLLDVNGETLLSLEEDYVPNKLLPPRDGCGDYIHFIIEGTGKLTNWYTKPSIEQLQGND